MNNKGPYIPNGNLTFFMNQEQQKDNPNYQFYTNYHTFQLISSVQDNLSQKLRNNKAHTDPETGLNVPERIFFPLLIGDLILNVDIKN